MARPTLPLLLLAMLSVSAAAMPFLNLTVSSSCPGDVIHVNASSSDGIPPSNLSLRFILYDPFYGLRGIAQTDVNGSASIQLTKPGLYRIYPDTVLYNHPDYVEFDYQRMCPPIPPRSMTLSVWQDCAAGIALVNVTDGNLTLSDVFVQSDQWSTMSGPSGSVFLPLPQGEDYIFIDAQKTGYMNQSGWFNASCT